MKRLLMLMIVAISLVGVGCTTRPAASGPKQTVTLVVPVADASGDPAGPIRQAEKAWAERANAELKLIEWPTAEFADRLRAAQPGDFDGVLLPAYLLGQAAATTKTQPIDPLLATPGALTWDKSSVVAPLAPLHQWGDSWHAIPYAASARILYYRNDILNDEGFRADYRVATGDRLKVPPDTWEDVLKIIAFLGERDWNKNMRTDEVGLCVDGASDSDLAWTFLATAAPYAVTSGKLSRYRGAALFDPETMEPRLATPGYALAFELLRRLTTAKATDPAAEPPPNHCDVKPFLEGRALFCLASGNLARQIEQEVGALKEQFGCAVAPGAAQVWDYERQDWKKLSRPTRIGNTCGPNWLGVVAAGAKQPALAYDLFAFHANAKQAMVNVTAVAGGVDPGRKFQFVAPNGTATLAEYTQGGFSGKGAQQWLDAHFENYRADGMLEYLRIPGADRFYAALGKELAAAINDPHEPADAVMARAAAAWKALVTEIDGELGGPGKLKAAYQASLGYKPDASAK